MFEFPLRRDQYLEISMKLANHVNAAIDADSADAVFNHLLSAECILDFIRYNRVMSLLVHNDGK